MAVAVFLARHVPCHQNQVLNDLLPVSLAAFCRIDSQEGNIRMISTFRECFELIGTLYRAKADDFPLTIAVTNHATPAEQNSLRNVVKEKASNERLLEFPPQDLREGGAIVRDVRCEQRRLRSIWHVRARRKRDDQED
jgi:hypothetical protein